MQNCLGEGAGKNPLNVEGTNVHKTTIINIDIFSLRLSVTRKSNWIQATWENQHIAATRWSSRKKKQHIQSMMTTI